VSFDAIGARPRRVGSFGLLLLRALPQARRDHLDLKRSQALGLAEFRSLRSASADRDLLSPSRLTAIQLAHECARALRQTAIARTPPLPESWHGAMSLNAGRLVSITP
jgi:hypothetical protein